MKYSIDTSALLDGWRRYYSPDVFPGLWTRLQGLIEGGSLRATVEVLSELEKKDDEVYKWAQANGEMFVPIDEETQVALTVVLQNYPRLVNTQRARSTADPWVIALGLINGCTVITGEQPSNNLQRPKIPDVCQDLGVQCMNLLQLFREEGWVFRT